MERYLVPDDVEHALADAGFRPVGPAGADGTGVLAVALDGSGRLVEAHVVASVLDPVLAGRIAGLQALRHEHLPELLGASEISPGRVALLVEHWPGMTLAQLRAARAPLTDGEATTVTVPVAQALGALHDAGLAHGAVSAATVVVRGDGRPLLVDLRGPVLGQGTADGDVRRLLAGVLDQMPGRDVHPAAADDRPSLRDALEDLMTATDVSAARVVDRCFRVAQPEPVRLPDAGSLAAADLVRTAGRAAAASRRERRVPRRRPSLLVGVAVALAAVVAVGTGVWGLRGYGAADDIRRPAASEAHVPGGSSSTADLRTDPVDAAAELTRRRAAVLATGDPVRLQEVDVPDGPAMAADVALVEGLGGERVEGVTVEVVDVRLVDDFVTGDSGTSDSAAPRDAATSVARTSEAPSPGSMAWVAVTSSTSAYVRTSADGTARRDVPAADARTVVLGLRWTEDGWRVWEVAAPG